MMSTILEVFACPVTFFFEYISKLELIFKDTFERIVINERPLSNFITCYEEVTLHHPCNSFPHKYLIHLYARMRLFYTLKFINSKFRETNLKGEKSARKEIIWKHI